MKIKSLLLGSAAALAISGGAYAADPAMAEFVSLDVCDAYGISGLTIASDDTCLLISGEVEYEFEITGDVDGEWETSSDLEWEISFEAVTQTDFGRAGAVITFAEIFALDEDGDPFDGVEVDEAYVYFGDTTVLMAGKKGTIFEVRDDQHIDLLAEGDDDVDDFFTTTRGGHVIQIVSEVADGFSVSVGLEDLENAGSSDDGTDQGGTFGAAVGYAGAGIDGSLGFVYGNIFGFEEDWSIYGDVTADLGEVGVYGGFVFNEDETWAALLTASTSFDMFGLRAGIGYEDDGDDEGFSVGGGVTFALTDTIDFDVEARYFDPTERFNAEATVIAALTDTITAEAYVGGWWEDDEDDIYYVGGELVYTPGGNFETSLGAEVGTNDHYEITFAASKSF